MLSTNRKTTEAPRPRCFVLSGTPCSSVKLKIECSSGFPTYDKVFYADWIGFTFINCLAGTRPVNGIICSSTAQNSSRDSWRQRFLIASTTGCTFQNLFWLLGSGSSAALICRLIRNWKYLFTGNAVVTLVNPGCPMPKHTISRKTQICHYYCCTKKFSHFSRICSQFSSFRKWFMVVCSANLWNISGVKYFIK